MPEFREKVRIASGVDRVWRALTDPAEVTQWDTGVVEPLDAPHDYPRPGQHVRWRYRLGVLPMTLHDRPSEVVENSVLRSQIRLGPFDFDETYDLVSVAQDASELSARMLVSCPLPVLGALLARTIGLPLARATVRQSLAAIRRHCESASTRTTQLSAARRT